MPNTPTHRTVMIVNAPAAKTPSAPVQVAVTGYDDFEVNVTCEELRGDYPYGFSDDDQN